jgi:hypothetical protein
MKTYICFNDESGSWSDKKRRFYIRASLIVDASQLKKIESEIIKIRNNLNLASLNEEIKWQDLWQLRNYFKNNREPKDKRLFTIYNYLLRIKEDYHLLIDYCEKILAILQKQEYDFKIILTFTEVSAYPNHQEKDIYKFHIQDHLQRLQMQFSNDIVIVVYDNVNDNKKKLFKEIHKEIITKGDFIKEYKSIYKSLLFDDSYDSELLQMVDFIAGSTAGLLTSISKKDIKKYQKAVEFFINYIYPKLRKDNKGEKWGAGIKETPINSDIREYYKKSINTIISQREQCEREDDLSF